MPWLWAKVVENFSNTSSVMASQNVIYAYTALQYRLQVVYTVG